MSGTIIPYGLLSVLSTLAVNDDDVVCLDLLVGKPESVYDFSCDLIALEACAYQYEVADVSIAQYAKYESFAVDISLVCYELNLQSHLKTNLAATDPTTSVAPTTSAINPVGCVDQSDGR